MPIPEITASALRLDVTQPARSTMTVSWVAGASSSETEVISLAATWASSRSEATLAAAYSALTTGPLAMVRRDAR